MSTREIEEVAVFERLGMAIVAASIVKRLRVAHFSVQNTVKTDKKWCMSDAIPFWII
jgi:hypothetical protein